MKSTALAALLSTALVPACGDSGYFDDFGATDDAGAPRDLGRKSHDLSHRPGTDLATIKGADLSTGSADLSIPLMPGAIGPNGGTVDRLFFSFHGDARPANCNDTPNYPKAIVESIFKREAARNVQFSIDLGDHFFGCGSGKYNTAAAQMAIYVNASKLLPSLTFLTMGNHECRSSGLCHPGDGDENLAAYLPALAPISAIPYYTFDVQTSQGLATFVVIADNAWDNTEQAWLESTLAKADGAAKYTIITRHHPIDNTDLPNMMVEMGIIQKHKYSLFMTGHTHEYKHDTYLDPSKRTLRMGISGAPFNGNTMYYGYGTVEQQVSGALLVKIYDQATDAIQDTWSVTPQ